MRLENVSCRDVEKRLTEVGVTNITGKRISEYCNAQHTPSLEKARRIMEVLDYPILEEELLLSLENNRQMIKDGAQLGRVYDINRELHTTIRIKLKKLLPECSPEENERYLRDRVMQLFGKEKSLSDYIQWLISKDLSENIISKEEILADEN